MKRRKPFSSVMKIRGSDCTGRPERPIDARRNRQTRETATGHKSRRGGNARSRWRQVDGCGQKGREPAAESGVTQHLQQEAQRAPAVSGVRKSKQIASL